MRLKAVKCAFFAQVPAAHERDGQQDGDEPGGDGELQEFIHIFVSKAVKVSQSATGSGVCSALCAIR